MKETTFPIWKFGTAPGPFAKLSSQSNTLVPWYMKIKFWYLVVKRKNHHFRHLYGFWIRALKK